MNLTLHLCWKDLRRLWIPIALFAAVIASKLLLSAALLWRIDTPDSLRFGQISLYVNLETAMEFFIGFAVAAAIVHEDVLVGTTAFWMTKPISGLRLLGAKVLTLLLVFAVMPCVITLPWWVACGLSLNDLVHAALGVVVPLLCTVLLSTAIATLTANFSRFIVWTIALFAAFTIIVATSSMRTWSIWGAVAHRSTGARDSAYALGAITVVVGFGAVIFHQYRTRRFWQSCAVLAGFLLMAFAFAPWWRWDLMTRFDRIAATSEERPNLTVAIAKSSLLHFPTADLSELRTELIVRGIPPGHVIVPVQIDATLHWRDLILPRPRQYSFVTNTDGTELPTLLNLPIQNAAVDEMVDRVSRRARNNGVLYKRPMRPDPHTARITYGASLLPSVAARVEKDPPGYSADTVLLLSKLETLGEGPLNVGQVLEQGSYRARIVRREVLTTGELEFGVVERQGPTRNESTPGRSNAFTIGDSLVDTSFVLVNRSKANFVRVPSNSAQSIRVSGILITWRVLKVRAPGHLNKTTNEFVREADWFDGASIAAIVQRPVTRFRRMLKVESINAPVVSAEIESPPSGADESQ